MKGLKAEVRVKAAESDAKLVHCPLSQCERQASPMGIWVENDNPGF